MKPRDYRTAYGGKSINAYDYRNSKILHSIDIYILNGWSRVKCYGGSAQGPMVVDPSVTAAGSTEVWAVFSVLTFRSILIPKTSCASCHPATTAIIFLVVRCIDFAQGCDQDSCRGVLCRAQSPLSAGVVAKHQQIDPPCIAPLSPTVDINTRLFARAVGNRPCVTVLGLYWAVVNRCELQLPDNIPLRRTSHPIAFRGMARNQ